MKLEKVVSVFAGLVLGWSLLGCAAPVSGVAAPGDDPDDTVPLTSATAPTPEDSMPGTITPVGQRKDGWSQSGNLFVQNKTQSTSLQANFPVADVYTVQFAVAPPVGGTFRAVANITWTVEGNQVSRQVDVGNGVSVSAPSQAVKVIVNDQTDPALGGIAGQKYGVTIAITRGVRPTAVNPPTLEGVNPAGGTAIFTIPMGPASAAYTIPEGAGATAVMVFARTSGVGPDTTSVTISQSNGVQTFNKFKYTDPDWIPLAPEATSVVIFNNDTVNTVDVDVVFAIDG